MGGRAGFAILAVLDGVDGPTIAMVVAFGAVVGIASLLGRGATGRRPRRPVRRPVPGRHPVHRRGVRAAPAIFSYWYALVPFEDGPGEKERPVLVLRVDGGLVHVLKVTSQDRSGRTSYRRVGTSGWDRPGVRGGSWLRTDRPVTIPLAGFRRRLGDEHDPLLREELRRLHPREFA